MSKGIFVLRNGNRKLYCKTILSADKSMLELVPLSKEELQKEGITVEESYSNTNIFSIDVEESVSDPDKKKVFNANDPKDMAEAERIAREQLERLKKTDPEHYDLEKKEDLEEKVEDLEAKLAIVAEKELERKMNQLNVPENLRATFRESPEKLQGFELAQKGSPQTPSGSMPLSPAQTGSPQGGYDSVEAMINDLNKRAKTDPNAKACLNAFWEKWLRAKNENPDLRDKTVSSTESPLSEIKRKCIDTKSAKESRGEA
jgi:hypothetical protein